MGREGKEKEMINTRETKGRERKGEKDESRGVVEAKGRDKTERGGGGREDGRRGRAKIRNRNRRCRTGLTKIRGNGDGTETGENHYKK